jgi:hypothetical protein
MEKRLVDGRSTTTSLTPSFITPHISLLTTLIHSASSNMSDEEQQAPPQTQDEIKPENPDTINVKVHLPLLNVLFPLNNCSSDRNYDYTGSDIVGRGSILQD